MKETLQMSVKEAERLGIMREMDRKKLKVKEAAVELGLSLRQVKRVRKRYKKDGEKGLISLKRGQKSNRKIDERVRDKALMLIKKKYYDFGPTLAAEKLEEEDGVKLSRETLRKWLIEEGMWKAKKKREKRAYQRRKRRSRFGELLQADGSPHDWFEERGPRCTLLQFVDDATSKTTKARFEKSETTEGYLKLLEEHLKEYGRPLGLYADKHGIFRVNREEIQKGKGITHFGQVLKELDIEMICANSPQAKGRVERKNGVFQDRLIKEMRLKGISTIEEANEFLPKFLERINQKFGKEAEEQEDAHRKLRKQDDLKKILAKKEKRKLSKDLTMQHKGVLYLIKTKTPNRLRHAQVNVYSREGEEIEIEWNGASLEYKKWSEAVYERPKILSHKEIETKTWVNEKRRKPGKHHPWR